MNTVINPIPAYPKSGIIVESFLVADNLADHAVIRWRLINEDGGEIAKGDIQIENSDYANWHGSNEEAEAIVLAKTGFVKAIAVEEPIIAPESEV